MAKKKGTSLQNAQRNNIALPGGGDSLSKWATAYFELEVTTAASSREKQRRAIGILIHWLSTESGSDDRENWTPRRSRAFRDWCEMQKKIDKEGVLTNQRRWSVPFTINQRFKPILVAKRILLMLGSERLSN